MPAHARPSPAGRPATRWFVLAVLVLGLASSMAVDRMLSATPGDRSPGPSILAGLDGVGPLVDLSGDQLRSARGDGATVALALIDTGDAASWDAAAAVLDRHGAHATWFVRGRTALDRRQAVAEVQSAGGELGVTGFSGRDLAGLAGWRLRAELSATQAVLAARQRVTVPLLALPGAATRDTFDVAAFRAARAAGHEGYAVVVGVAPEEAAAGDVAVVPLDARGPARLEALLSRAAAAGAQVSTVSAAAGMVGEDVNRPVGAWVQTNAVAVVGALTVAHAVSVVVRFLFVPLTLLLGLRAVLGMALALAHARRARRRNPRRRRWTGPVTVVVPAYNESAGIEATLRSLVASRWRHRLIVIVVDDGSTDGTADIAERLALPGVYVVRQPNQGKPAALNTGLALARTEVVVLVDADTVFEPGTVAALVAPFGDPRVGGVSGNAKVVNRRSLLGRWQHIEYVIGFNLDRRMLAMFHAIPTVPGAAGAFRRQALQDVGGVSDDTLAEDTDLTIAVQRAGWRVVYEDRAVAWTEAPASVGDLWRQRYRWCYGTLQAAWKHRRAVIERRGVGLVGLPYAVLFQVGLAAMAPLVDVVALTGLVTGGARAIVVAWLAFSALQVLLGVVAFRLDRERLGPLWAVPFQQFFYRQLMYLVVLHSVAAAMAGTRLRWHKLRRLGEGSPAPSTLPPSYRSTAELSPWAAHPAQHRSG